jgi:hypothetical protein
MYISQLFWGMREEPKLRHSATRGGVSQDPHLQTRSGMGQKPVERDLSRGIFVLMTIGFAIHRKLFVPEISHNYFCENSENNAALRASEPDLPPPNLISACVRSRSLVLLKDASPSVTRPRPGIVSLSNLWLST